MKNWHSIVIAVLFFIIGIGEFYTFFSTKNGIFFIVGSCAVGIAVAELFDNEGSKEGE